MYLLLTENPNLIFFEGGGGVMEGQTNRPKPICPFNFFEVGGITIHKCTSFGPDKLKFITILSFDLHV